MREIVWQLETKKTPPYEKAKLGRATVGTVRKAASDGWIWSVDLPGLSEKNRGGVCTSPQQAKSKVAVVVRLWINEVLS